jgi:glycosyltransferase involved in cell wall biosynthesis
MQKISACLIVWNGEKLIRDCLESITDVVDEIVVVHDGPCSDRTLAICREYTKKVYVRPYVGEAEPHRPFTFAKATGDWILWIDQDERLTPRLRKDIRKLVQRDDVAAYSVLWPIKYGTKNLTKGFFSKVRKNVLFRKDALTGFRGLPNEMVRVRGKTVHTEYSLIHLQEGERCTLHTFFTKTLRIVRIHADQLVRKQITTKIAPWYLIKAFSWFLLYCGYYYILHLTIFRKSDISIAFQLALYNFFLYWYVFLRKLGINITRISPT